jgi:hypothetical protein
MSGGLIIDLWRLNNVSRSQTLRCNFLLLSLCCVPSGCVRCAAGSVLNGYTLALRLRLEYFVPLSKKSEVHGGSTGYDEPSLRVEKTPLT